jgi:hypothetical protein
VRRILGVRIQELHEKLAVLTRLRDEFAQTSEIIASCLTCQDTRAFPRGAANARLSRRTRTFRAARASSGPSGRRTRGRARTRRSRSPPTTPRPPRAPRPSEAARRPSTAP